MAITQKTITTAEWTPLTTSGQNATAWLDEDGDGEAGAVDIRVFHTTGTPGAGDVTKGKKLFKSNSNTDMLVLVADSATDVFYAIAKAGAAIVSVDAL